MRCSQFLLGRQLQSQNSVLSAVPIIADWRYSWVKVFLVVLKSSQNLDLTPREDLSLVCGWNFDISSESHSNGH